MAVHQEGRELSLELTIPFPRVSSARANPDLPPKLGEVIKKCRNRSGGHKNRQLPVPGGRVSLLLHDLIMTPVNLPGCESAHSPIFFLQSLAEFPSPSWLQQSEGLWREEGHGSVLRAAERVRLRIMEEHGSGVLPECYTGHCTCDFVKSARRCLPASVLETAIYTEDDGVVDWRYCINNDCNTDFAVRGTHIGLAYNPTAYSIIANRLAEAASDVQ